MDTATLAVCIVAAALILATLALIVRVLSAVKKYAKNSDNAITLESFERMSKMQSENLFLGVRETNGQVVENVKELSRNNEVRLSNMSEVLSKSIEDIRREVAGSLDKVRADNEKQLEKVRADNEKQLEAMRAVVEEKLTQKVDENFKNSFLIINDELKKLGAGIQEMQTLSEGVTDLRKVLGGVKNRGTWGEASLEALLSDILTPAQFKKQFALNNSSDPDKKYVDFAVILPGDGADAEVYLPIDSKFPVESYIRMTEATERGDLEEAEAERKKMQAVIKKEAQTIRDFYIRPPKTTDFAVLFLPSESIYAEVLKTATLVQELQQQYKIILAGPSNFAALLNSLRLGFKSLQIQKNSVEVLKLLTSFSKDFEAFMADVDRAQKSLSFAQR